MWKRLERSKPLPNSAWRRPDEPVDDPLAVVGPFLPRLLLLDDDAADLPVGLDHGRVDRLPGPVPGRGEDLTDLPVERVEPGIGRRGGGHLGTDSGWFGPLPG